MSDRRIVFIACRWVLLVLALLILAGGWPPGACAWQAGGSLRLNCHVQQGEQTVPLGGDTYAIVQIAAATLQQGTGAPMLHYQTKQDFAAFACDWDALTDQQRQAKAAALEDHARQNNLLGTTRQTDEAGEVVFDGLDRGLYLVVRTKAALANAAYAAQALLVGVPTVLNGEVYDQVTAVPKFEDRGISIRPSNLTIYMGGNEGYDAVEGEVSDSLPHPMFVIQAPASVPVEDLTFQYRSNTAGSAASWQVVYLGHDEQGSRCYRFAPLPGTVKNFPIRYLAAGTGVLDDAFEPQVQQELFKLYRVDIPLEERGTLVAYDAAGTHYPVITGTAVLTVRGVERTRIPGNQENPVTDVLAQGETVPVVPAGVGIVVAPAGTTYVLNQTDIEIGRIYGRKGDVRVGLLFDNIINAVYDRQTLLQAQADARMPACPAGVTRHFQSQYLDLVDMNNGNVWVTASKAVEVYWGYPEGTGQETAFTLWHFPGLHRDGTDDPGESGYDLEDIMAVEPEQVAIENTPQGIRFTVEPNGFSPFVLVWEEGTPASKPVLGPDDSAPQTGDSSALTGWLILLGLSLAGSVGLFLYQKRKRG